MSTAGAHRRAPAKGTGNYPNEATGSRNCLSSHSDGATAQRVDPNTESQVCRRSAAVALQPRTCAALSRAMRSLNAAVTWTQY